jgi:hypothetical protein
MGLKSVNNCEQWGQTMIEEDDDILVYKKEWAGLTEEDLRVVMEEESCSYIAGAKWAEEILKRKNT